MIRTVVFVFLCSIAWSQAAQAQWPDGGVVLCGSLAHERGARCSADGIGHFWIGWGESQPPDTTVGVVRLTRRIEAGSTVAGFDPCGLLVGNHASSNSTDFALATDGTTGVFVAWSEGVGGTNRVLCLHLDETGVPAPGWPAEGILVASARSRDVQAFPDGSGGVYLSWVDSQWSGRRVLRLTASGTLAAGWEAGERTAFVTGGGLEFQPYLFATDGFDGYFGTGSHFLDGHFVLSRYRSDGSRPPGWVNGGNTITLATVPAERAMLLPDGLGGAFVRWYDGELRLQHVLDTGGIAPGWPTAGRVPAANVTDDGAIMLAGSGLFIATTRSVAAQNDLFLQRIDSTSVTMAGWPVDGYQVTSDEEMERTTFLTPDGTGGLFLTWTAGDRLMVQRRDSAGGITPGWPQGGIQLSTGIDSLAFPRCVPGSGTSMLVVWSMPSGHGDRDSRVLLVQGNGHFGSTVGVDPPTTASVAFRAWPNPSRSAAQLLFDLPAESDVEVAVFDPAGRTVWQEARSTLAAGAHRIAWPEMSQAGRRIPNGVYFARLSTRWGTSYAAVVRL